MLFTCGKQDFTEHYHMLLNKTRDQIIQFSQENPQGVIIIRGATATGKSNFSLSLAESLPIEIISSDSRQLYKYMDIGTDKVSKEIRRKIPHHMIDIIDPGVRFTAGQRKQEVTKIIGEIHNRGKVPVIVGGTGLYIDTLYKNFVMSDVSPDEEWRAKMVKKEEAYPGFLHKELVQIDPDEAHKHHPNSTRYILRALEIFEKSGKTKTELAQQQPVQRPLFMIGLRREKEDTNYRINKRIKQMFEDGLEQEVKGLLDRGYTIEHTAMNGIGYKEIVGYLQGEYNKEKAEELLKRNTHRYAKRQRSWFRRYIAEGIQFPKENVTYLVHKYEIENLETTT